MSVTEDPPKVQRLIVGRVRARCKPPGVLRGSTGPRRRRGRRMRLAGRCVGGTEPRRVLRAGTRPSSGLWAPPGCPTGRFCSASDEPHGPRYDASGSTCPLPRGTTPRAPRDPSLGVRVPTALAAPAPPPAKGPITSAAPPPSYTTYASHLLQTRRAAARRHPAAAAAGVPGGNSVRRHATAGGGHHVCGAGRRIRHALLGAAKNGGQEE